MSEGKAQVLSSGGGTQSNCILVLILAGLLPRPDLIVIADTGRERPVVWKYMDEIAAPACNAAGLAIHRVHCRDYGYAKDDLFNKKGTLLIPAFSDIVDGGKGKLPNFCTTYWKIEAVDNWLSREHGIKRSGYVKWIGFSLNEGRRAARMMSGKEYRSGLIRFPLIHDVPLTREQAVATVERFGWPKPPRSACWMCPNQSDMEWLDLKQNWPVEFGLACDLDEEIRQRDPNAYLHESRQSLREVVFSDELQADVFNPKPCDSGVCFV